MSSKGAKRKVAADGESDKRRKKGEGDLEVEGPRTRKRTAEQSSGPPSSKRSTTATSDAEIFHASLIQEGENPNEKYFPIAVVGIGCRMPGEVYNLEDFRHVIEEGRDVISEVPEDRWSLDKYWHPDPHNVGTHANRRAGFCTNVHDFDHTFYNVSPREAANMDVMQRHILEVTQESLDDAGIPSEKLPKDTGVYVGICLMDHGFTVIEDAKCMNAYTHTGTAHSVAANRVSYAYDIRGPSVAIDTACAASLTSMHYASFALWNKECPVALVTASNTLMVPEVTVGFSALGVLAPDGISCPFSANAKGYVRSEGTGSIVLKPLHEAIKDGNHIYCTVRASWLAHNGYSLSITMPSTDAQADMMKKTYEVFGLNRDNTDFIEAHGTGTPVGDPLEAEAIAKAFTLGDTGRKTSLAVGSSKSNFGHMEGAAGMVQVIKAALMLENRYYLPNINYGTPNPAIDTEKWKIHIPEKIMPYNKKKPMRIGVNTFGFGGALAHMLLEEYKPTQKLVQKKGNAGWRFGPSKEKGLKLPIPLSAKSTAALRSLCEKWKSFASPDDAQEVVSYLALHRSHYNCRLVIFADSGEDFRNKMQMYIDKQVHDDIVEGTVPPHNEEKKICFIFPGQGQQTFNMGRTLYKDEPVFRKAIDACDTVYKKLSGISFCHTYNLFVPLKSGKQYNEDVVNEIQVSQPAILFLQIGLYDLTIHWGVRPDALVGHSLGEVAAAYASGAVNLQEAVTVQYHRAEQQVTLDGTGTMAALRVSAGEGERMCKQYQGIYVACNNAQESITIAGSKAVIKQICADNPGNAKELRVRCAFHTPHMDPLERNFMKLMKGKLSNGSPTNYPWYSTVTGDRFEGSANAKYFWDNIRGCVDFLGAVRGVLRDFENVLFLELAGAATLLSSVRSIAKNDNITPAGMVPCGQRNIDDRVSTLRALSSLHTIGIPVDWRNITNDCGHWMRLPLYAWQHSTFRYEAEGMRSRRLDLEDRSYKGLHGLIRLEQLPFLRDHVIRGQLVFPRSGFVEYMMQHNYDVDSKPSIANVKFHHELIHMSEDVDLNGEIPDRKQLCIENIQIQNGHRSIITCDGIQYAQGDVVTVKRYTPHSFNIELLKTRCKTTLKDEEFYGIFGEMGVEYADFMRFKLVEEAYIGDGEVLAYLHPALDKRERIHTTILDAAFTVALVAHINNSTLLTPAGIKHIHMTVNRLPRKEKLYVYSKLKECDTYGFTSDIYILTESGKVLAEVYGFEVHNMTNFRTDKLDLTQCIYTREWQPITACMPQTAAFKALFSTRNLQKRYPQDLVAIENAEKHNQIMKDICATFAMNAVKTTPESEWHQKMIRYGNRLKQMAETVPAHMTYDELPMHMQKLGKEVPEYHQEIKMIQVMGKILPETLKDPKSALVALFTEEMMAAYFIDSITTKIYYKMLGDAVKLAVENALKLKKIVRVIEVGGRLGGLTQYILPCIESYLEEGSVEYCFTDINVAFFSLVQEKLKEYKNVRFQQFDPESDIISQNFVANSFDLVVCLDTLHCTENAVHATSNIRDLLCEDGWLAVMESTNNHNTPEIIFGAFDLCWVFEDDRVDRCWLGQKGWTDVMEKAGFSDVVSVSTPNEFYHSLLVGRKINMELAYMLNKPENEEKETDISLDEGDPQWIVITTEDNELAQSLKKKLPSDTDIIGSDQFCNALTHYTRPLNIVYFYDDSETELNVTLNVLKNVQQFGERKSSSFYLVTKVTQNNTSASPNIAMALGFIRTACSEITNLSVYMIGTDNAEDLLKYLENHTMTDREICLARSTTLVPRIIRQAFKTKIPVRNKEWRLEVASLHDDPLDSIDFHAFTTNDLARNEVRIIVQAVPISKSDLQSGKVVDGRIFGTQCSGIVDSVGEEVKHVASGDHVIAFADCCMASVVTAHSSRVFRKPSNLTFEQAAGLGLAFCASYYALLERAYLKTGETILLHDGCSWEGQAMIQVAKYSGAKVICVAGNEAEMNQLKEDAAVSHVTTPDNYHADVMIWTANQGVDVTITSSEDTLGKSIQALAHGGRLCHIGNQFSNGKLLMETLEKNIAIHTVQINLLMEENPNKFHEVFSTSLQLLKQGSFNPLSFDVHDISGAVKILNDDVNAMSNIVLKVPTNFCPDVEPALDTFRADVTYMVTGSSGGIGQAVARWISKNGARHIALVSRNGHKSWFQKNTVKYLEDLGVSVYDVRADISSKKSVRKIFTLLNESDAPKVDGIFHLAGINQEKELEYLTKEELLDEKNARSDGANNLHEVTCDLKINLSYFVMISSSKTSWGCPGFASFNASCSYVDQLAVLRKKMSLTALSVQAGWLRGAGWLEDRTRNASLLQFYEAGTLHVSEFLSILHKLLDQPDLPPVIMITNEDWDSAAELCSKDSLLFRHYASSSGKQKGGSSLSKDDLELKVVEKLGALLMMSSEDIDVVQPMIHYGVDSLISLDITNWMRKEFNLQINQMDILEGMTAEALIEQAL